MALKAELTPLVISLVEGSADAFVQGSVLTGLTGNVAYNCRRCVIEIATISWNIADDSEISIAVTRRSKTAMPAITDSDVLFKHTIQFRLTTSGAITFPAVISIPVETDQLAIVEETLYAQLDSSAMGVAITAYVKLECQIDTMSPIDRLNLISRSLT